MVSLDSPLKSLETSVEILAENINELETKYSNLFSKYQDSFLLIDLYSSFVDLFYADTEKSLIISSKKQRVESLIKNKYPLMLVSARDADFGKINYYNQNLIDLFECDQDSIRKEVFTEFFPPTNKILSLKSLKNFKKKLLSSTVYIENNFFILNSKNFIVEVSITITLIGFYREIFLFSIKKIDMEREACIICKGKITYYTEGLEDIIERKRFWGVSIENLLEVRYADLKVKKNIKIKSNQILVVYNKITLNNEDIKILYFYRIKEVYKQTLSIISCASSNIEKKVNFEQKKEEFMKKKNKNNCTTDSKFELEKRFDTTSNTSTTTLTLRRINLCIENSMVSITFFKRILMTSVIYKQIMIITLSNFGILIYFSLKINSLVSDDSANILGQTYYSMSNLANIDNIFQKYLPSQPSLLGDNVMIFNNSIIELQETLNNYTSFSSKWSVCVESQILFDNSIPTLLAQGSTKVFTFMNIFNFISLILEQVKNI